MPEDIRGLFKVTPSFLRVEEPSKRLPRFREKLPKTSKNKKKKTEKKSPEKGRLIDVIV